MTGRLDLSSWINDATRPTVVIGEVAQAHDGSLGLAHSYIDAIADAGAHAVKFQTHIAAAESTPAEPWRVRFSEQDATRYDYWKRMEFQTDEWASLKRHCEDRGLLFLSSPFSVEALDLLEALGIAGWKIASGETGNTALLERVAGTSKPVLLSTGMSPLEEIDRAVNLLRARSVPLAILQCTSKYPCPPEAIGLNLLEDFRERYACPVGLSDHSGTIFPGLAAAALGADVIEVHVTLSRQAFGPDVEASVTCDELQTLVEGVQFIGRMRRSPVIKDQTAADLEPMRLLFTKSLVAIRDLPAGHVLQEGDLVAKKPGTGLSPDRLADLLGQRLLVPLKTDDQLEVGHLEVVGEDPSGPSA